MHNMSVVTIPESSEDIVGQRTVGLRLEGSMQ
jgi:hypothetical protein